MPRDFFENRVCVLTGATGGIGRALALELTRQGARLVLSGRNEPDLVALQTALPTGAVVATVVGDLQQQSVQLALATAAEKQGAKVLINLFGGNVFGLLAEQTPAAIADLIGTNLTAPILLTRCLLPYLMRLESAVVVNVGSVLGEIGHAGYTTYCATKFGVRGFSEALRREIADTGVKVLYFAPRATRTPMNGARVEQMNEALGNTVDEPARVAQRIVETIVAGRSRRTLGWPEWFFCKVNALLPGLVDNALAAKLAIVKRYAGSAGSEIGGLR